eukprot:CAMPEP_0194683998 /NCGR_PEP_ID=MMETSP0295-20121207/13802_1 /TAXON_ID=39354 /ORGANISM="Heterosigma akashiwo, Strain CCMP2393" /LENGTH=58 /DNA_ID=CAMNT_0039570861 /DNA_START=277 /DNA_END=450 /DNA_ORIENTATION=+
MPQHFLIKKKAGRSSFCKTSRVSFTRPRHLEPNKDGQEERRGRGQRPAPAAAGPRGAA